MLSVLIVNWNTRDLLRACLASIASHPPTTAFEVIVVDNASTDGSAEMVRVEFPAVVLVESPTNTGYAAGNNLAFSRAKGDWLLTLNPDTEVYAGTLNDAVTTLDAFGDAGCLGIRQVDAVDGHTQRSVRGFPSFLGILGALTGLGRVFGGKLDSYLLTRFNYEESQVAPQPMGTFLLFRRAALESVGDAASPFDKGFPIFFNEVDLLYRLRQKGWICIYSPEVKVLHYGGESTKLRRKSMVWESHKSLVRYFYKHHGTGIARVGLPFLAAVIYGAAFIRAKGYHAGFRA